MTVNYYDDIKIKTTPERLRRSLKAYELIIIIITGTIF